MRADAAERGATEAFVITGLVPVIPIGEAPPFVIPGLRSSPGMTDGMPF